ncbi:RES domain-containing protein [Janthinobacterium rivuli]|uniref:RES domain-containing protein n=1 Tax=Janthinobacterium rivuli TaxID=2751478 RepID=A0ABY8I906_9BURK|nr:RES domain-containing protein [Janthinobacterium rivuli]WFR81400.1 RES domain-containing protein [Janthinobacterium rivuli]
MPLICYKCIDDVGLKKIIEKVGNVGHCSICEGVKRVAVEARELGKIIEPTLRKLYSIGEEQPRYSLEADGVYYQQQGEYLEEIIESILEQELDCVDEIASGVIEADNYWPQDGEYGFWDDTSCYERNLYHGQGTGFSWEATLAELKHSRRFFSPSAQTLFTELFAGLDTLRVLKGRKSEPVVTTLPEGSLLYRARSCRIESEAKTIWENPLAFVGPPPLDKARAGRMNAEGVVVLYCAKDIETCLAEMRPALGGTLALITLKTREPLRILDFSLLEKRFVGGPGSVFEPNYFEELERRQFLKRLHHLISQPIVPGHEADYLITQTMAEYLAHVHDVQIDGISFSSAQRASGVNVVLFPSRDLLTDRVQDKFGVEYVEGSIKGFKTESIRYRHSEVDVEKRVDGSFSLASKYDPDLDF